MPAPSRPGAGGLRATARAGGAAPSAAGASTPPSGLARPGHLPLAVHPVPLAAALRAVHPPRPPAPGAAGPVHQAHSPRGSGSRRRPWAAAAAGATGKGRGPAAGGPVGVRKALRNRPNPGFKSSKGYNPRSRFLKPGDSAASRSAGPRAREGSPRSCGEDTGPA